MLYVYTSIVDGFDNLRPPAAPANDCVKYICFTNVPNLPRVHPWEYRPIYDVGEPCRTARVAKILPHLMLPSDAEYSIYHDGNFQLRHDPQTIFESLVHDNGHDWAAHQHPCRTCIYEEAKVLLNEKIGTARLVQEEIARYRESGHPEHYGLWANGLLVRRHTPAVAALNERWWQLYSAGSERDQLSFPVALRESGISINTIRGSVFSSTWMLFKWHAAWRQREDNPDYFPQRNALRQRLKQLKELTKSDGHIQYVDY